MCLHSKIVFLNNQFLPIEQAKVSVLDRGFLFGDGVYEVIPVFGEKPLRQHEHLNRLEKSLNRVGLENPYTEAEWVQLFKQLLDKNPGDDRAIYLQITRGSHDVRDLSASPVQQATVFIMVSQVPAIDISEVEKGIEAVTINDFRWQACDIKSISLVANVMLRQKANEAGVQDAILIRDGIATEGTASNLFIVKDGVMITAPKSNLLLAGITRDLIVELAEKNNRPYEVRAIAEVELSGADEIWLTSSTREIAPVLKLNGKVVGEGTAGEYWRVMINLYQQFKQALRDS